MILKMIQLWINIYQLYIKIWNKGTIMINFIKSICKKIIPSYIIYIIKKPKLSRENKKLINIHKNVFKDFKKAFIQYVDNDSCPVYLDTYINKPVKPVKEIKPALNKNDPILLCVVKDDLRRIKLQVEYHRKIGVKHFAYIDNMSKDGTFEWLMEQEDVSLFFVNEIFSPSRKDIWRKLVIDFLGYDKWYLDLDSDELFMYPGIETLDITKYIDFLEKEKIKSALSPMIDMYSKGKIFENSNINGIFDTYCYFDSDTYKITRNYSMYRVIGGPRMRLFSTKDSLFYPILSKYALTKFSKNMLPGTHINYPYKYNLQNKGAVAFLLHYKFLPEDNIKYKGHTISEVHSDGSKEYKRYMEMFKQNPDLSFYYEGSQKLNDSMDLMKINIIDKKFYKNFLDKVE
jgi:hypothetical protein